MSELYLGVDVGTSSTKGVVADGEGTVLARASVGHETASPAPGMFEHDADGVWWADAIRVIRALLDQVDPGRIAAVGVSGLGPCLLPAGADGQPLRPAMLYGIDTRAVGLIPAMEARCGREEILRRSGSALSAQAVGPKLAWLEQHEPQVWAETRRVYSCSSYLVHRLTGEYVLDRHSASQFDPLYDLDLGHWAEDWWDLVAGSVTRPPLLWSTEFAGVVNDEAAQATGLVAGTPVTAGTIDAWAEAASIGVRTPGSTMVMYGTTLFFVTASDASTRDERLWSTAGNEPGSRSVAAGLATGGALLRWFSDLTATPLDVLLAEAAHVPAGARGLLALPYFAGERTPIQDAHARGVVVGLGIDTSRAELTRMLLEATAFAARHNLDLLEHTVGLPLTLTAVGGGSTDRTWAQVVSDVTGRPQVLPRERIGAAYGDALLAARAYGAVPADADWVAVDDVVEPDPAAAATLADRYQEYLGLYPQTVDLVHRLGAVS